MNIPTDLTRPVPSARRSGRDRRRSVEEVEIERRSEIRRHHELVAEQLEELNRRRRVELGLES